MKPALLGFALLFIVFFSSCNYMSGKYMRGNGVSVTQEKAVGDFDGVSVKGGIDVIINTGTAASFKIEADENLLPYIEVENHGNVIEVSAKSGYNLDPKSGIKVWATAPSFSVLEVTGSGDIQSTSRIVGNEKLHVEIKGSGDVRLDVDAPKIQAEIAGSGNIIIKGRTQEFYAAIKGSGDIQGFDLLSENTTVDISGSGNVEVYASKQLAVDIKGAGDVRYKGAAEVHQDIKGAGSVKRVQ